MNRLLLLLTWLLLTAGASAQTSIGMTIGQYVNWGSPYSFKDAAALYPQNIAVDSAMKADYENVSRSAGLPLTVGANFRVKPTDSTKFMYRWSRNYGLTIGEFRIKELESGNLYTYDVNVPYTIIYQGDTSTYLLDSSKFYLNRLEEKGALGQLGFGMMRELPTKSRVKGEIGFSLTAGIGRTASYYTRTITYAEEDTTANFTSPNDRFESQDAVKVGTQNIFLGGVSLMGGVIIPLAKDDETWWLSLHGAVGVAGMYAYDKWIARMSFVPTLGINYRFQPKTDNDGYR